MTKETAYAEYQSTSIVLLSLTPQDLAEVIALSVFRHTTVEILVCLESDLFIVRPADFERDLPHTSGFVRVVKDV